VYQTGVGIVQARLEAERLKTGVGVGDDVAERIVVETLGDRAGVGVDDQPDAAREVADEAVGCPVFDHVVGREEARAVDEETDDRAGCVGLGDGREAVLVDPALGNRAVYALSRDAHARGNTP